MSIYHRYLQIIAEGIHSRKISDVTGEQRGKPDLKLRKTTDDLQIEFEEALKENDIANVRRLIDNKNIDP